MNEIPKSTRYPTVMEAVYRFFKEEKIKEFPIDPFEIIEKNRWGLMSYTDLSEENGMDVETVKRQFHGADGFLIKDDWNYTVAYDDTQHVKGRIRFTLMHEIGHIYLNHLIDFDKTTLQRGSLNSNEYDILEREAHAFARNTLTPAPIVKTMSQKWEKKISPSDLKNNFHISNGAAKTRIGFLSWDINEGKDYVFYTLQHFKGYLNDLFFGKQCLKCQNHFIIEKSKFCPICGSTRLYFTRKGFFHMNYPKYKIDRNNRVLKCPNCENEEIDDDKCKICGNPVVNKCSGLDSDSSEDPFTPLINEDDSCQRILDANARFCTKCGYTSSFLEMGYLVHWKSERDYVKQNNIVMDSMIEPIKISDIQNANQESEEEIAATISDSDLPF